MMLSHNFTQDTAILLTAHPTRWADHIDTFFKTSGWPLVQVSTYAEVEALLSRQAYWLIVTEEDQYTTRLHDLIHRQHDEPGVLLVLITDDVNGLSDGDLARADLVLPPDPLYIDHQLRAFLNLHTRYRAIAQQQQHTRAEIEALQRDLAALKAQVRAQKRATDEIEVLKNAIVRNVSHELKTPLLHLKSAVSLIAEDTEDGTLTNYALNATARLEALIRNITMLGQSLDFSPAPTVIGDAIESAKRNLSRAWQSKDEADRIKVDVPRNLPPVMADRQGLSVALQLLIDNALKFSEGVVTVRVRREDDTAYISIHDEGIGIDEQAIKTIFEAFFQIDSSSTRRYGGAGIGLALVKLILDRHGSEIEVTSHPGEGSTFGFRLELAYIDSA